MSLQHSPEHHTTIGHPSQPSTHGSEMGRVMCLSRQKLQLESARDEPDLRKLLAHACTVEHIEGWIRENPPSRMAPSPVHGLGLNDQESGTSLSLRNVKSGASMFHHWPTGHLDRVVTVVREVEDDNEEDGDSSEESWDGSDTSDDTTTFDLRASKHGSCNSGSSPAATVCQDFAYDGVKVAESLTPMPRLLSIAHCRELATMLCA